MNREEARTLFVYDAWANALMFEAVAALPPEQPTRPVAGSFPSLLATLAHIVGAEWIWMRHWLGESPTEVPGWLRTPALADIRARLAVVEHERDTFLAKLSDADLARPITYRLFSGDTRTDPLADLVTQAVNHATYHRGQVANQLRELGHKPPSTDFILYRWQAK